MWNKKNKQFFDVIKVTILLLCWRHLVCNIDTLCVFLGWCFERQHLVVVTTECWQWLMAHKLRQSISQLEWLTTSSRFNVNCMLVIIMLSLCTMIQYVLLWLKRHPHQNKSNKIHHYSLLTFLTGVKGRGDAISPLISPFSAINLLILDQPLKIRYWFNASRLINPHEACDV